MSELMENIVMSILETLTLSDSTKRTETADPKVALRRRMAAALDHQIAGATAEINGQHYVIEFDKWVFTDKAAGVKERRKVQRPFRRMWYRDASDNILVELKFANKPLLVNGKPSIMVGSLDKLASILQTVKKAVSAGELDAALYAASESRKKALKRKAAAKTAK